MTVRIIKHNYILKKGYHKNVNLITDSKKVSYKKLLYKKVNDTKSQNTKIDNTKSITTKIDNTKSITTKIDNTKSQTTKINTTKSIKEISKIDDPLFIFKCPNCLSYAACYKSDIRCTIFRHACFKRNMLPVNPHASKEALDLLIKQDLIYGCAKPFRLILNKDGNDVTPIKCGYI